MSDQPHPDEHGRIAAFIVAVWGIKRLQARERLRLEKRKARSGTAA